MSQLAEGALLFGLLALQNGFISRDQLVAAFGAWTADKARRLDQILLEQKALDLPKRDLLAALEELHLAQHANDPAQSLAALSSIASARSELEQLQDSDLSRSLGHVAAACGDLDSLATRPGMVSLAGQRFEILRPHAGGGLGIVSIAKDKEVPREVALKEIRPEAANNLEARARFLREAEITGGLEHPGIVPIYGLGTYADGRPYYAMKFIKGDSLKTAIEKFHARRKEGKVGYESGEFRQLLQRFIDVCNAVQYAHDRGVLHRDLKPGNIMLGEYGETLVVDWGLAKPLAECANYSIDVQSHEAPLLPRTILSGSQTQTGAAIGTPQYMSPEQAAGKLDELGPATDVYALGATLYVMLTDRPTVDGHDAVEAMENVRSGRISPPKQYMPTVPGALQAICLKALSLEPSRRYALPKDLAADVEHWLADEPILAAADTQLQAAARVARRHRGVVATTMAALFVIAVGATIAASMINQQRNTGRRKDTFGGRRYSIVRRHERHSANRGRLGNRLLLAPELGS